MDRAGFMFSMMGLRIWLSSRASNSTIYHILVYILGSVLMISMTAMLVFK